MPLNRGSPIATVTESPTVRVCPTAVSVATPPVISFTVTALTVLMETGVAVTSIRSLSISIVSPELIAVPEARSAVTALSIPTFSVWAGLYAAATYEVPRQEGAPTVGVVIRPANGSARTG